MAQHTAFIPAIDAQPARELLWHNVKVWEDIAERMDDDGVIQKCDQPPQPTPLSPRRRREGEVARHLVAAAHRRL